MEHHEANFGVVSRPHPKNLAVSAVGPGEDDVLVAHLDTVEGLSYLPLEDESPRTPSLPCFGAKARSVSGEAEALNAQSAPRMRKAPKHDYDPPRLFKLNDVETPLSAAALIVGLVLLWTWRKGLEADKNEPGRYEVADSSTWAEWVPLGTGR